MLLGYAGSHLVAIAGAAAEEPAIIALGVVGHFMTPPITHWANGMVGRGFGSLGLHLGLPFGTSLVFMGLGALADDRTGFLVGFAVGGVIGFAAAPIIDVAWLAYKPLGEEEEPQSSSLRFTLTPIAAPGATGINFAMQF